MADYKSMYYHLAGRMAVTVEVLGATVEAFQGTANALGVLKEKLMQAQQTTEEMLVSAEDEEE